MNCDFRTWVDSVEDCDGHGALDDRTIEMTNKPIETTRETKSSDSFMSKETYGLAKNTADVPALCQIFH